jgi:hypothetical protein
LLADLLAGSPAAQAAAKVVLRADGSVPDRPADANEGVAAFSAGREAAWIPGEAVYLPLPSLR